ncbi:MAG: hypothetical protein WD276_06030 [Actinomycetota bacterium]
MQGLLDKAASPRAVPVVSVSPLELTRYGKVLLIRMGPPSVSGLRAAVFAMIAAATITGKMRGELGDYSVVIIQDTHGDRGYIQLADMLAFADGEISAFELKNRTTFDLGRN